jgi:rhodanese-related sulfurtransferase
MSLVLFGPRPASDLDVRGRDLERDSEFWVGRWRLWVRRELHVRPLTPVPKTVDDLLEEARATFERVTAEQASDELRDGAVLIDTRTFEQRTEHGDIPGAIQIGLNVLEWRLDPASEWHIPEVTDHDVRVIVVCQEGYSSSLAAARLQSLGLHRATDVIGGFDAWRKRRPPRHTVRTSAPSTVPERKASIASCARSSG